MATKRAKVNKTLEKAKKLVSKKGKKKVTKRSYPEGQNAPQSKAYDMENDKTVPAKRVGYRFTKEGAKKLSKKPNDRPTEAEIDKYRNQTFKVKGKVNKSGPKGVGDGSFRYLYIESRADKSDLNKARKLELGGYNPDEMHQEMAKGGMTKKDAEKRLEELRKELRAEKISYAELAELQSLKKYIDKNDVELLEAAGVDEFKKGGEMMAKGGKMFIDLKSGDFRNQVLFDPKEVREFEKYVFSYYGKNGMYADIMEEGVPATTGEVLKAVSQYLAYLSSPKKSLDITWGGGDTVDRELVRDIIIINRNPKASVTNYLLIKDMKKTPILEYGGILQPMIGGVNADPRFDIYNTTMFAEKGAKLDKGYSKKEIVIDYYLNNDIFDDPETYGVSEEDLKDAKKKNDFSKLEKAIIKYHDLNDPSNVEERFEVLGLDDEYAKGGKLPSFGIIRVFHTIDEIRENGKYLGDYMVDESYDVTYAGNQENYEYKGKTYFITTWNDNAQKHDDGDETLEEGDTYYKASDSYDKGGKTKSRKFEFQAFFYDCAGKLITSEYYVDAPSDKEVFELAKKLGAKTGQLYRINYDTGEFIELVADYDCIDEYAKGGETKIYEVATRTKGKSGQFASSVRAKSKEDALRIYKEKHGDDKNKVIVDVYETTRKRLEDGGEMAKGGEITKATLKKREIKKINQLIEEYAHKGESIEFYEPFKINVNDADYLVTDVMEDGLYVTDSEGYDGGMPLSKLTFFQLQKVTSQIMDNIGEMAKGGKTHYQSFEDFEDERIAIKKKRFFQLADKLGLVKGGKYIDGIPEGNEEEVDEFYTLEDELDYPKPQKVNLAHGGKTHEQGYDDREDERLAMRHGKIASKDFVGSHKRREHSRRDDARFETRNK